MKIKISIIVPVYNVEKYLRQALDSLINQTYVNWEAICINDGSTDNSLEILKEYAQKDSRFIVVDKENEGVSIARNIGLSRASGEYIMFLDPDDYYNEKTCELALKNIEEYQSDVAIFGYNDLFGEKSIPNYRNKIIKDIIEGIKEPEYSIFVTICMKIFRRNFLLDKNISFLETQDVSEDMMFSYYVLLNGAKISLIDESLYFYRRNRENSLTTKNINGIKSEIKAAKLMVNNLFFKEARVEMQKCFVRECFRNCFYYYDKFKTVSEHLKLYFDILKMLSFWESKYDKKFLTTIEEYRQLKLIHKRIFKELLPKKVYSEDFETYLKEINFKKYLKNLKKKLNKKTVVIYGTGLFYQYITENCDLAGINIIGVSDMKFSEEQEGKSYLDYKIIPKSKIAKYNPDFVLIAAKNYESILEDFKKNLLANTKTKVLPLAQKN